MNMNDVASEMPRYKCHKEVWALKIASLDLHEVDPRDQSGNGPSATITPADSGYAPFDVDPNYVRKHKPQAGGYYVVYRDGYKSWSPASEFEDGYTRI